MGEYLFDDIEPAKPKGFRFFDHQVRCVDSILRELRDADSCFAVSATGTGKTEMIVKLIQDYGAAKDGCVVISPRIELVGQTAERLRKRGIRCGVEQAANKSYDSVTVASYATLLQQKRHDKYVGSTPLVVVDECHHNFTDSARRLLDYFRDAGSKVVGFTATPRVGKRNPLDEWYGKCVFAYTYAEARDDGRLVPAKLYMSILEDIDYSRMSTSGDYNLNSQAYQDWCRQEKSLQPIRSLIEQEHEGLPSVVFVSRIDQAQLLADMLARTGIKASLVHSRMDSEEERRDQLRRFEDGETNVVINVGVLTMGWDFPPVRKLFICRPTQEIDFYTQMFGRAVRPLPGVIDGLETAAERRAAIAASDKPFCEIYDFCDASRHSRLVTAMDVLHPQRREIKDRRPPMPKEGTNQLDPDEIVAAEQAELARQKAAMDRLQMSRRQGLVMDGKFSHYERDATADIESQDRRGPAYRVMLWGKHKRKPFHQVPTHYLEWTLENCTPPRKHPGYFPALRSELTRRRQWKK